MQMADIFHQLFFLKTRPLPLSSETVSRNGVASVNRRLRPDRAR